MTEEPVYSIGPGIQQAMADYGDEPRSNEDYIVTTEGHAISRVFGRDALWMYYQEDNAVKRCPFR